MHTPGPWHIDIDGTRGANDYDGPLVRCAAGMRVAVIMGSATVPGFGGERDADANARLIAAAPELLAALKRAIPWLGKMIADGAHMNSVLPNDCVRTLGMAEAAVAEAEGKR